MAKDTLRRKAYQHIHSQLASGRLKVGSVVSEMALAKEIGISRTPVREAIRQLQTEGFIEQIPRFGTIVRKPARREIVETFQLREALESYAAALAAEHMPSSDLTLLRKLCEQLGVVAAELKASGNRSLDTEMLRSFLAADMAFHALLIRAAGNERIMKIINDLHILIRVFGAERHDHRLAIVEEACEDHQHVFEAIEQGDADAARRQMARHIRRSMKHTLDHYDQMQAEVEGARAPLPLPDHVLAELERIEDDLSAEAEENGAG